MWSETPCCEAGSLKCSATLPCPWNKWHATYPSSRITYLSYVLPRVPALFRPGQEGLIDRRVGWASYGWLLNPGLRIKLRLNWTTDFPDSNAVTTLWFVSGILMMNIITVVTIIFFIEHPIPCTCEVTLKKEAEEINLKIKQIIPCVPAAKEFPAFVPVPSWSPVMVYKEYEHVV